MGIEALLGGSGFFLQTDEFNEGLGGFNLPISLDLDDPPDGTPQELYRIKSPEQDPAVPVE